MLPGDFCRCGAFALESVIIQGDDDDFCFGEFAPWIGTSRLV
jgi:hypothetical protein